MFILGMGISGMGYGGLNGGTAFRLPEMGKQSAAF
nr:MAG TPA: hypothetical protein [Caudoviricetes sp.]